MGVRCCGGPQWPLPCCRALSPWLGQEQACGVPGAGGGDSVLSLHVTATSVLHRAVPWHTAVPCHTVLCHVVLHRACRAVPHRAAPRCPLPCPDPTAPQLRIRLKGGAKAGEGRVEVLKSNEWGTVCDDRWNLLSASVVCRELGFGSAKEALTGARMGQGEGPGPGIAFRWLRWASHSQAWRCSCGQHVVQGLPGASRGTAAARSFGEGRAVLGGGQGQLRWGMARLGAEPHSFSAGTGPIHLNEVQCLGTEKSLWSCPFKNITQEDCKHTEDAAVRCNIPYMGYENLVRVVVGAVHPWGSWHLGHGVGG